MYLGLRLSHTLPGNPTPARKVLSRLADSNSGTSLDGLCQTSTQRSTPASRSTRHSAPTSYPRHSPKARSILGVASSTVAASARICVTVCCMSLIASLSGWHANRLASACRLALMGLIQARADIGPNNSKLFQAELERRAIYSEARRRPAWSSENPPGRVEDCQNVRALGFF